jgi:hypothetical protein
MIIGMTFGFLAGVVIGLSFCMATIRFWFAFAESCFDRGFWRTLRITPRVLAATWRDRRVRRNQGQ